MTARPREIARRRGRPARLSRDQIVEAALELVGGGGMDALSMRRLAAELGVSAMTLYGYFSSKSGLVRAMLDAVSEEIETDIADDVAWPQRLRLMAHRIRSSLRRYPGLAPLFIDRPDPRGRALVVVEDAIAALRAEGVPAETSLRGVYAVIGYAIGFVAQEVRRAGADAALDYTALPAERFPNLRTLVDETVGFTSESQFEFGLEALIEGVRREARAA